MARLFATTGAVLDTVDEGAQYIKDRIATLRYDAIYDSFNQWWTDRRPATSVPPHLRDEYVAFCKAKKESKQEN